MEQIEISNAANEVLSICEYINPKFVAKIPTDFMIKLKELATNSNNCIKIDINKKLSEQEISETGKDLITLIYYVKQNKYIPYIVEIKDGKIENTSILKSSTIKASDSQIKYFLSEIISNIFIISIDPKIQDKNLEKVSSFLTNETYTKVQNLLKENQIKSKIEKGYTTDLEIISINEIPETKNHQMRFLVTEFNNTGKVVIKTYYSIIFKTIIKTNKNEKSVFLNPLGLIVTDFNLTKEKEEKISF